MSNRPLQVLIIFAFCLVVAGLISYLYNSNYTSLQLEVADTPIVINATKSQDIPVGITNHDSKMYALIKIALIPLQSSGHYLRSENITLDQPMTFLNEHETKNGTLYAIKSEGYSLKYKVNIESFANNTDHPTSTKQIDVTVVPYRHSITSNQISNPLGIKFDTVTSSLTMKNGETKNLMVNVKNNENKTFDNLSIKFMVENSSGQYLDVPNYYNIAKTLMTNGDTTGEIPIPFKVKQTEGYSLQYKVDVILYSNNSIMDSKQVDVTITS